MIEMAHSAGYDFVCINCEHMLCNHSVLVNMLRMARLLGMPCQVRIEGLDPVTALLSLEARAIMAPYIDNTDAALAAVTAVKFEPLGKRGMDAGARVLRYGGLFSFPGSVSQRPIILSFPSGQHQGECAIVV